MTNKEEIIEFCEMKAELESENEDIYEAIINALEQEPDTWSLEDAREDFVDDVYNTLDFLPTNDEANQIIDSFDRVTSSIRREYCTVTEFADRCRECGARYGKLLKELAESEDCISREAALEQARDYGSNTFLIPVNSIKALPPVIPKFTDEEIDRAQAVEQAYIDKMVELVAEEAKRPKGKWISHREHCENLGAMPNGLGAYQWCSNCDCAIDVREWQRNHYNFCPNCGADMRESEE